MAKAAKKRPIDLREIIRRLNPNVPAGLNQSAMPRTPRHSHAIQQLRTAIEVDHYVKALLTGHIGVGKSTELLQLAHDVQSDRFVIQCSAATTLGVQNVDSFSILLVILDALIKAWADSLGEMPPGLIDELVELIRNLLPDDRRPSNLPGGSRLANQYIDWKASLGEMPARVKSVHQLADVCAGILRNVALRYIAPTALAGVDMSKVIKSCEILIKEMDDAAGKPLLLIIDDLDKVRDEAMQEDIFIDRAMAWMRLPCGVVATLPLDALFAPRGRELDQIWGEVRILEPLPVPTPNPVAKDLVLRGTATCRVMLHSVGADRVISESQCDYLACLSGGIPRAFIHACAACVNYAYEAGDRTVLKHHVELVERDLTDRWRGRLTDSDYEAIVSVLDSGGSNVPMAIPSLRDGLIIRDGNAPGDRQFRLASWAKPLIEAYRKRMRQET